MISKTNTRGFTLIELLVVIAIIGILASVVLASLNTARDKGTNASYRSSANNMRAQAELFYDDNSRTYTGLCADSNVAEVMTDTGMACAVNGTGTAYAMAVQLIGAESTESYCVDSTGTSGDYVVTDSTEVADFVCDGS